MSLSLRYFIFCIILSFLPESCFANRDAEILESKKCVAQFQYFEQRYNLPKDSLYSISLQETKKKHSKFNIGIVWPWTVNVEGIGHHFKTKAAAVNFTKDQINQGKKSIDVGCMQVNLKYHPNAFKSINQAFSPQNNIAYASKLLKEKYNKHKNWTKAIGSYHSESDGIGKKYSDNVKKIAQNISTHKENVRKYTYNQKYNKASIKVTTKENTASNKTLKNSPTYDMFRMTKAAKKKYNVAGQSRFSSKIVEINN